jgi:hypothetical protein
VPYGARVFSTMNSPGSFGTILSAAIVLSLKRRLPICMLTIVPMLVGLALCQYRSLWAATAFAVLMVLLSPKAGVRPAHIVGLALVGLLMASSAFAPRINEAVFHRASSLTSLAGDESLRQRLLQYQALGQNEHLLAGEGLAINGAARRLDNRNTGLIDGAIIEIYVAMGVFVGTAFILAIGTLIGGMFSAAAVTGPNIYFDRAIVLALFLQFPIGTVHVGELGFCAWTFLGLALAARLVKKT